MTITESRIIKITKINMATYKVLSVAKRRTTTGKDVADLELEGVQGKVSMWGDHPHYANVQIGYTVDGDVVEKGQYKTLYAPRASTGDNRGGFGSGMMKEKASNIEHAQERKEDGIMTASTASMATLILTSSIYSAGGFQPSEEEWKGKWVEIRHWLVNNWNNTEQKKVAGTAVNYPENLMDKPPF